MTADTLAFHTIPDLRALSLDELRALWELVPTDRQHRYQTIYQREVRANGAAGSDALEQQVIAALIQRYAEAALVPVGTRWARTPARIQQAVRDGLSLTPPEADLPPAPASRMKALVMVGAAAVCLLGFMLVLHARHSRATDGTPVTGEVALDATATQRYTPTPTPIALEEQDVIIRDGVRDRAPAYPVSLQVLPAGQTQPRVFVVQRREVELSEWQYDANPDTASYLSSLSVRPVIGLPWSEENAALFASLETGSTFSLRLNTGAVQQFDFASKAEVSRSDTSAFRQVEPGLVLVLLGERDAHGAPTATRLLVLATYPPPQELSRDEVLAGGLDLPEAAVTVTPPAPTATPIPARDLLYVEVIAVETIQGRLSVRLRLYNGQPDAVALSGDDFAVALGYSPQPPGPWTTAEGLAPLTLLPGQAADLTLHWAWAGEPYAALQVTSSGYAIYLET